MVILCGFSFDGQHYEGHPGDTLASALLANGVRLVGRSFKYHRPRGIVSDGVEEPSALVQLELGGFSEPNRWGSGELQESAVRPELVAEVRYDKVQGNRFRHGSRFIRFRDDKDPDQCTWREVRPPRRKDDPTFESLLSSASA